NTFLDVNTSPNLLQERVEPQQLAFNPDALAARNAPSADRPAELASVHSEPNVEEAEAPSSEQHRQGIQPAPAQADEGVGPDEYVEAAAAGHGTGLVQLLFLVSVPVIWTCWMMHQKRSRRLA